MSILGIFIGLYAYGILFLGLFSLLYKNIIIIYTVTFFVLTYIILKNKLEYKKYIACTKEFTRYLKREIDSTNCFLIIVLQVAVNLIGALAPELAFGRSLVPFNAS